MYLGWNSGAVAPALRNTTWATSSLETLSSSYIIQKAKETKKTPKVLAVNDPFVHSRDSQLLSPGVGKRGINKMWPRSRRR